MCGRNKALSRLNNQGTRCATAKSMNFWSSGSVHGSTWAGASNFDGRTVQRRWANCNAGCSLTCQRSRPGRLSTVTNSCIVSAVPIQRSRPLSMATASDSTAASSKTSQSKTTLVSSTAAPPAAACASPTRAGPTGTTSTGTAPTTPACPTPTCPLSAIIGLTIMEGFSAVL